MNSSYQYIKELLLGRFSVWKTIAILFTQLLGVCLVSVSIYFAFDIENFFKASSGDDNYVILTQEVSTLSDFMGFEQSILPSTIDKLEAMEGVSGVGEFLSSNFRVVGSLNVGGMGRGMSTEMFFEAVDSSFIDVKSSQWGFNPGVDDFVPIIIPQNYVNLYNFGFSNSMGLPKLSKDVIGSVEFDLLLYRSDFGGGQPMRLRGKVIGFSNRINTILAPLEFVQWANEKYGRGGSEEAKTSRLILEIDPLMTSQVLAEASALGLETENTVSSYDEIGGVISMVVMVVVFVGIMITLLSVALMVMMLYVLVERNRSKIENLRMLGFSSVDIFRPYGTVLSRFMLFGVLGGWLLGLLLRWVYVMIIKGFLVNSSDVELDWSLPSAILILLWISVYFVTRIVVRRRVDSKK